MSTESPLNIFALSYNPGQAAQALCDKHVPKMVLETAQLLCSPFEPKHKAPYKRTHYNHPCTRWVRESPLNYAWLVLHGEWLLDEYVRRFARTHKSEAVIVWCREYATDVFPGAHFEGCTNSVDTFLERHGRFWDGRTWSYFLTPFAQAMPEQYRHSNPVTAYRAYYIGEKARFAKWERGRKPPRWWK